MIEAASAKAASAATNASATAASIRAAVNADSTVNDVRTEALQIKQPAYNDTRATSAVETVIDAIIDAKIAVSRPVVRDELLALPYAVRLRNGVARLFSPYL